MLTLASQLTRRVAALEHHGWIDLEAEIRAMVRSAGLGDDVLAEALEEARDLLDVIRTQVARGRSHEGVIEALMMRTQLSGEEIETLLAERAAELGLADLRLA